MMIEATDFRNAMSLLTSAVSVVTTAGMADRHGFTASAVCSVTDTPPTLLVCMNKTSRSHAHFIENEILKILDDLKDKNEKFNILIDNEDEIEINY